MRSEIDENVSTDEEGVKILSGELGIEGFLPRLKFAASMLFTGVVTFEVLAENVYESGDPKRFLMEREDPNHGLRRGD